MQCGQQGSTSNRTARGRPHNKGAQEQRQTYRGLGERDEHERGAAHVHEEPADPELVKRVRLDHLRARTGTGTPRFVRGPAARSGAKAVWRRKGAGANTLSLRERGGRMRVPFFWRTLPMLLPAVPASVSATDSHISPPPAPIRSDPTPLCAVRLGGGIGGRLPSILLDFLEVWRSRSKTTREGGREVAESWARGRAALFSAARPCTVLAAAAARRCWGCGSLARCCWWRVACAGRDGEVRGSSIFSPMFYRIQIQYSFRCLGLNFGLSGFGRGRLADFSPSHFGFHEFWRIWS